MPKKTLSRLYFFISLSIGVSILLLLVYQVGFKKFSTIMLKISPALIVAALMTYSLSWLFRTLRLKYLTSESGNKIRSFDLFKLGISGYALNNILPAHLGEAALVGYLRMKGIALGQSAAIVIQSRVLDLIALTVMVFSTMSFIIDQAQPSWAWKAILLSMLIVAVLYTVGFIDRQKKLSNILDRRINGFKNRWVRKFSEKLKDVYDAYYNITADRRLFLRTFISSCIIWLIEGLTCFVVSLAVGIQISIAAAVFAVSIANMAKAIPVTIGGLGVYESVLAAILVSLGHSFDVAIVTAILDHFIKKAFTLGFGIPATLGLLGREWGRAIEMFRTGR